MRKLVCITLLLATALFAAACNEDDLVEVSPSLSGTIRNAQTDARLEGATVTIQGHQQISNAQGIYVHTDLDTGRHTVRVTRNGFQPIEREVEIRDILTNVENFSLTPAP
jgi:hypothetical protein